MTLLVWVCAVGWSVSAGPAGGAADRAAQAAATDDDDSGIDEAASGIDEAASGIDEAASGIDEAAVARIQSEVTRLEGQRVTITATGYTIEDIAGEGKPVVGTVERRGGDLFLVTAAGPAYLLTGVLARPRIAGPGYKVWALGQISGPADRLRLAARRIGVLAPPAGLGQHRAPANGPAHAPANGQADGSGHGPAQDAQHHGAQVVE